MGTSSAPSSRPLSAPQELFCRLYAVNPNATACYQQVYPKASARTARQNGSRLLTLANVTARIAELAQDKADQLGLDSRYVLSRAMDIADADRTAVVDDRLDPVTGLSGGLVFRPLREWPVALRRAVSSIKVRRMLVGTLPAEVVEVRFESSLTALKLLGEHLALFAGHPGGDGDERKTLNIFIAGRPWIPDADESGPTVANPAPGITVHQLPKRSRSTNGNGGGHNGSG